MPYKRMVALALAMTTLTVAGCGGSSAKSSSTGTKTSATHSTITQPSTVPAEAPGGRRLTRAELVAKADAVCRRLNKKAGSMSISSLQDIVRLAPRVSGYYRMAFAELRRLAPPVAMASDWRAIVTDIQPLAGEIMVWAGYARDNDPASVAKVEGNVKAIQQHRFAIARRDGFRDCGEL
jgi:hypothetical protein